MLVDLEEFKISDILDLLENNKELDERIMMAESIITESKL